MLNLSNVMEKLKKMQILKVLFANLAFLYKFVKKNEGKRFFLPFSGKLSKNANNELIICKFVIIVEIFKEKRF